MADVYHDFPVKSPRDRVMEAVSTADGLDCWWTKSSRGVPAVGAEYELGFGPEYNWVALVTRYAADSEFELQLVRADQDWTGTTVGFRLEDRNDSTWIQFYHAGWPESNEHYRISCNCWALYLRILRRYLEHGEFVPYEQRLDA